MRMKTISGGIVVSFFIVVMSSGVPQRINTGKYCAGAINLCDEITSKRL
jgi:hypothetical protein